MGAYAELMQILDDTKDRRQPFTARISTSTNPDWPDMVMQIYAGDRLVAAAPFYAGRHDEAAEDCARQVMVELKDFPET